MTEHTEGFVDVRGKRTRYARGGEGPTLVYLHSAMGETSLFGTAWLPFLDRLATDFDVVSTVHPGFGDSEGLDEIDDVVDLVFHYMDLFDALDIGSAHLVGLSLGGWIAAEIATFQPGRVDRLVLVDAVGIRVQGSPVSEIFGIMPAESARLMFHRPEAHPFGAALLQMQGMRDTGLPRGIDVDAIMPTVKAFAATAKVGWNPYLHDPKLPGRLHRVTAPALCLWGEEDSLVPAAHADEYARLLPRARVVKVPDCGHMLPLECEEAFVSEIRRFLLD